MEFVYMTREGVEKGARIPETAVPHWEGHGWVRADPPPKPAPIKPADVPPDTTVQSLLDDAPPIPDQTTDEKPAATTTTKKPSSRRKED